MPAGAVIRVPQALSGITGRKASVGGFDSPVLNVRAQPERCAGYFKTRECEGLTELTV